MKVVVTEHYTHRDRVFAGSPETVRSDLIKAYGSFLRLWLERSTSLDSVLKGLEAQQPWSVHVVKDDLAKTEQDVLQALHGVQSALVSALAAARFLVSGSTPTTEEVRRALWDSDGDVQAAALKAYGLEATLENRAALQSVVSMQSLEKSEPETLPANAHIEPGHAEAAMVAEAVARGIEAGEVEVVRLGGKHSKGSMLVQDPAGERWLLKPGSGGASPAAGVRDDPSTQSQREACFYQIAALWGLADDVPQTELLFVQGKQYAAIQMLASSFVPMETRRDADPSEPARDLEPYRQLGALHKWAVLDAVLGNTDRHAQNIMVGADGAVKLIDHGSAFAGRSFDPATDRNTFTPYYLRFATPLDVNFNTLLPEEKLEYLVEAPDLARGVLRAWLATLDGSMLRVQLTRYGIDPEPSCSRLEVFRAMAMNAALVDHAINRWWVTV